MAANQRRNRTMRRSTAQYEGARAGARGVSRRDVIGLLGRSAVVAGAVAAGVGSPALGRALDGGDHHTGPQVRAVAHLNGAFYALVEAGPDVATIRPLVAKGSSLSLSDDVVAEAAVTAGPAAMVIERDLDRILVVRTTKQVLREHTYSFELDDDLAAWFEAEGVPAQDAPTRGTGTYRETVSRPAISIVGSTHPPLGLSLTGSLLEVSLEPVAVRVTADGYEVVATSSGRYGTETNLADEVVVIALSKDGSVSDVLPVATRLGHDIVDVKAVEAAGHGFSVAIRSSEGARFFAFLRGRSSEVAAPAALARLAIHDRIPVAGLPDAWLAEVGPGFFVVENANQ